MTGGLRPGETEAERDDRNLAELLQELRVAGLGVQMIFGFLLATPFANRFSEEELNRAKENVKGRMVLSFESTLTHMNRLGGSVLMGVPLLSLDEMLAEIDAVTLDDVASLARELFAPKRLSAAGVGADEDVFRRALEPVSEALAAA